MIDLQFLVPHHFHNAWDGGGVRADCLGDGEVGLRLHRNYLVNKAGFGMITDLRNDLYDSVLRRSTSFFQKHSTGMLISTLINDIERVQNAMSTILSDFLQQSFTLLAMMCGGYRAGQWRWVLLLFLPVVVCRRAGWAAACVPPRDAGRTSWRRSRTSCRRRSRAMAS